MANHDVVIIGLPSSGLQKLAGGLAISQLQDGIEFHGGDPVPEGSLQGLAQSIAGRWTSHLGGGGARKAILAYRTPWGFLEDEVGKAALAPGAPVPLEAVVGRALGFWRAYHLAMLGLRREREGEVLLINADRPIDTRAARELVEKRFLLRPGPAPAAVGEAAPAAARYEEIFSEMTDTHAPECLELYAAMESCADLLGRKPEFDAGAHARRKGALSDALNLIANQGALERNLASASAQLDSLKHENGLYLVQLGQIQEELERSFDRNQQNESRLTDLQRRLEQESAPLGRKIAQRMLGLKAPGAEPRAPSGDSPRGWYGWLRGRIVLRRQLRAIRQSGLLDEAWYLATYPDVAQARLDPVEHYLKFGAAEARNPSPGFDTRWYLETNRDVAGTGMNPLLHFAQFGKSEGRQPMPPERSTAEKIRQPVRRRGRRAA